MLILHAILLTRGISKMESALEVYKKAGRWIVRAYGPWINLAEAFHVGLAEDQLIKIEESEDADKMYMFSFFQSHLPTVKYSSDEDKRAYIKLYRSILSQVPNFKKTLESFGED